MIAVRTLTSSVLLLAGSLPLAAQEFRVMTRIQDLASPSANDEPISTSTTLFHAGRVYDYVAPAGELIVIDHANRTMTLLDMQQRVATTVAFDEIMRLLKLSRSASESYLRELADEPGGRESAALLRFHLDPEFDERFETETKQLELLSKHVVYRATCSEGVDPSHLKAYLQYADWVARLNHVLNPHAPFPAARLALDEALRERSLLPVEVELELHAMGTVHAFRAVHRVHWELDSNDRRRIHYWQGLLDDEQGTRRISFRDYQQAVLAAKSIR